MLLLKQPSYISLDTFKKLTTYYHVNNTEHVCVQKCDCDCYNPIDVIDTFRFELLFHLAVLDHIVGILLHIVHLINVKGNVIRK